MDGHSGDDQKQSTADMTAFVAKLPKDKKKGSLSELQLTNIMAWVQNLLQQMQSRFQTMSDSIITKIDEMGVKIDELEQNIQELRTEMGIEGSPSPAPPKSEPKSADDSA